MKKLLSALSSIALLFSLPALAAPAAGKAVEPKSGEKGAQPLPIPDTIRILKGPPIDASSPICRGGGG